jgi:phage terminase large subunit GpA-like protein
MRRKYPAVKIWATKGASYGDPEIYTVPSLRPVTPVNPNRVTKADKYGLRVLMIGTNKGKDFLNERWKWEALGKGLQHAYSGVRDDYWDQITAEVKAPNRRLGGKRTYMLKVGARNEALDCEVGAEHAARSLKLHVHSPAHWDAIESSARQLALFADNVPEDPAKTKTSQLPPSPRPEPTKPVSRPPKRQTGRNFAKWRR